MLFYENPLKPSTFIFSSAFSEPIFLYAGAQSQSDDNQHFKELFFYNLFQFSTKFLSFLCCLIYTYVL